MDIKKERRDLMELMEGVFENLSREANEFYERAEKLPDEDLVWIMGKLEKIVGFKAKHMDDANSRIMDRVWKYKEEHGLPKYNHE